MSGLVLLAADFLPRPWLTFGEAGETTAAVSAIRRWKVLRAPAPGVTVRMGAAEILGLVTGLFNRAFAWAVDVRDVPRSLMIVDGRGGNP